MARSRMKFAYTAMRLATAIAVNVAIASPAHAQVATDGTLGPRLTLSGPNYSVGPGLGRPSGSNLFYSFSTLNVRTGENISFAGGSLITNIIARVTGGSPSSINGQISASAGANLFLLNPAGIFFGPGASLNLSASFYASTASHLVFADGSRFGSGAEAVPADSVLPFTAPVGFRFDGTRAPITLTGSQLVVRNAATLGLFGGDVQMTSSGTRPTILSVLGGTAAVAATGGGADVALDGRITGGIATGRLDALGGTVVAVNENASGTGSGRIVIRGGDVYFEKAQLLANTRLGNGREIDVEASGLLSLKGSTFNSLTTGKGDAGKIALRGNDILLEDVSVVDTSCDPGCTTGRGGDIDVRAGRSLVMRSDPALGQQFIASNSFGAGDTGRVTVTAPSIVMSGASTIQAVALSSGNSRGLSISGNTIMLSGGAQVDTSSRGTGSGGTLNVQAQDIVISGDRLDPARQSLPSGFFSNVYSTGLTGSIDITTGNLSVLAGGEISSSSARRGFANGGAIVIRATGNITISGMSPEGKRSSIVSNTFTLGDGGSITITADRIDVLDSGLIQTQSEGSGASGSMRLVARDLNVLGGQISSDARAFGRGGTIDIQLSGALTIARTDPNAYAGISARTYGPAAGGSVVIRGKSLLIRDQGEIFAGTIGTGKGGDIGIALTGRLTLNSGGAIQAQSDDLGDAANVVIDAGGGIDISNAKILTSAKVADGGNIRLTSGGQINVLENAEVSAEVRSGTGSGGNVELQAGAFTLRGGRISASSVGGTGGNVAIRSDGTFTASASAIAAQVASGIQSGGNVALSGGSLTLSDTTVSANAFSGAGGSIRVQSAGNIMFDNARLSADVAKGFGSGGNISVGGASIAVRDSRVTANTFSGSGGSLQFVASGSLLLDRSSVTAQVSGDKGIGGSIGMAADSILLRDSAVSASAFSGGGGNLKIGAPGTTVLESSRVSAEVFTGLGDGGNLDIEGGGLLLRNSVVSANAYGGNGGNILIDSKNILTNPSSKVTASSQLGIDGTVVFSSPAADLSGALFAVNSAFLDGGVLQGGVCAVPQARGRASLAMRVIDAGFGDPNGFLFPITPAPPAPQRTAQYSLPSPMMAANVSRESVR